MSETFTVSAVSPETKTWGNPPNGPFREYRVRFQERGGTVIVWSKRDKGPDTRAPQVGETVTGSVVPHPFDHGAMKFKQEYNGGGGFSQTGGGGGAAKKGEFRTKEQIILQQADLTAAILMLANTQGGIPWNMEDFQKTSAQLAAGVHKVGEPYGTPPAPVDTAVRRDRTVETGVSDVPSDGFEQPTLNTSDADDIPF